jgi:hypothetical protein
MNDIHELLHRELSKNGYNLTVLNHHINSTINNAVTSTSTNLDINMEQTKCSNEYTADLAIYFRNDEVQHRNLYVLSAILLLLVKQSSAMNVVHGFTMTVPGSQHQLLKL